MRNKNLVIKRIGLVTGFTIVELIVVITIIGVLATTIGLSYKNWQTSIVTAQLKSDLNGAASAMENARTFDNEYPSIIPTTFTPSEGVTLTGGSTDGGETYCIDAVSSRDTSFRYYITSLSGINGVDQGACPFAFSTTLTATAASMDSINLSWGAVTNATSYTLQQDTNESFTNPTTIATQSNTTFTSSGLSQSIMYYYRVNTTVYGNISNWSDTANATTDQFAPSSPVIAVILDGSNVLATIIPVSCSTGTAQYGIRSRTNNGAWESSYSVWSTNTTATQVAVQGIKYGYQAQARCYVSDISISTTIEGTESTYTHPITAPSAPTVTATTVTTTTSWSWTTPSCVSSTTVRYQYKYTITPSGYDSGWVAISDPPIAFTTSTGGQTYTVHVQAQCYNANISGAWSVSGQASYATIYNSTCVASTNSQVACTETNDGSYVINKFTYISSAGATSWAVPYGVTQVEYLVVGGGGGTAGYGGGGGGGFRTGANFAVSSGSRNIIVGIGGTNSGGSGGDSTFSTITSLGGGGGGQNGGSGGGGASALMYGRGTAGQGNDGGSLPFSGSAGGGGGGASGAGGAGSVVGTTPNPIVGFGGNGGAGTAFYGTTYAGGGGGSGDHRYYCSMYSVCGGSGSGGSGGGGAGGFHSNGVAGAVNTGGGGGGASYDGTSYVGGSGGSGIVIIRYLHP